MSEPSLEIHNVDCETFMENIPDGCFDIAIADPPYGIGKDWKKRRRISQNYDESGYTNTKPSRHCFEEILRVSRRWVIWGWNYFTDILPPTNYLIVWDKMSNSNPVFKYSKCEIAGTSFRVPCNLVSCGWDGYRMGSETGTKKIHPHQKPVDLYRWLLGTYLGDPRGQKVFDPFAGSGSLAVACREKWVDYDGCEIEPMFFGATMGRIKEDVRYSRADVRFVGKDGNEIEWDRCSQRATSYTGTTPAEGREQAGTP